MKDLKFNLNKFIKNYVSVALNLIKEKREMPFSEFENIIRERVSKKIGISKEDVAYLHHSFHWTFFCRGNESPFRYIQPRKRGEVSKVGLNGRQFNKSALVSYILENYKEPYLIERAKQF